MDIGSDCYCFRKCEKELPAVSHFCEITLWQPPPPFDQEFFRARTDEQLRKGIRPMQSLNRAPMPHFAGELTADEVRQVLGYLRTLPPET
jgi:hypothetical protein